MDISWQTTFVEGWLAREQQGRLPHAVLLGGPAGVGKRHAARWIAARHLKLPLADTLPQYPGQTLQHPDLQWIQPAEGKQTIGIDQIRELVDEISLTSYQGGGKAAVVDPADAMSNSAANSLLKTLEEPPGNALLVLIADRKGNLPATIFSRCQRIDFALPPGDESLAWLNRLRPDARWPEALQLAGHAPLAAIQMHAHLDLHAEMQRDFSAVAAGRSSAVSVAERWSRLDTGFVLSWLARAVHASLAGDNRAAHRSGPALFADSVLERMDRRNLFCYLDNINRLRAQLPGSFNVQLALEGLLIDLSEGLQTCTQAGLAGDMSGLMLTR